MTTSSREEKVQRYLDLVFRMNPVWQAVEVLDFRRKALGLKRHDLDKGPSQADLGAQRNLVRRQIAHLQGEFWKLPLERLQHSLNAIDVQRVPEFGPVVSRLKTAADCRGEFPKLSQMPGMDLPLFNAFRSAAVLPPVEAGRVRDRFLRSIDDRKRMKAVQKAAKLIQTEYPALYALEQDWFATLTKMKRVTSSVSGLSTSSTSYESSGSFSFEIPWYGWWAMIVLLKIILVGLSRH